MRNILILVHHLYEELELWYPKIRLEEAGFKIIVTGPEAHKIYDSKHGYPCKADCAFDEIDAETLAGVIIPGGFAPDKLRSHPTVLKIVRRLNEKKRLIAFIAMGVGFRFPPVF